MPTVLQFRGFTTAFSNLFTGQVKEITVDTDKDVPVVHDGVTPGGHPVAARANADGSISLITKAGVVAATISPVGNLLVGNAPDNGSALHVRSTNKVSAFFAHNNAANPGSGGSVQLAATLVNGTIQPQVSLSSELTSGAGPGSSDFVISISRDPGGLIERARITSAGNLLVGTALDQLSSVVSEGVGKTYSYLGLNNGVQTFRVLTNGDVQNTNNVYGAISDAKLKENVEDSGPKLEKLNQLRVVNYNLIGNDLRQIGLIAQEVEQIFPGLVVETPDTVEVEKTRIVDRLRPVLDAEGKPVIGADGKPAMQSYAETETYTERVPNGEFTKSIKYSVLVPMLLKGLQELTARVQVLESAP